jgi:hypothetical protein
MGASAENHASFGLCPEVLRAGQWTVHLERSRGRAVSRLESSELGEFETRGVVAAESAPARQAPPPKCACGVDSLRRRRVGLADRHSVPVSSRTVTSAHDRIPGDT